MFCTGGFTHILCKWFWTCDQYVAKKNSKCATGCDRQRICLPLSDWHAWPISAQKSLNLFESSAVQKSKILVELQTCCKMNVSLQKTASIQPKMSPYACLYLGCAKCRLTAGGTGESLPEGRNFRTRVLLRAASSRVCPSRSYQSAGDGCRHKSLRLGPSLKL